MQRRVLNPGELNTTQTEQWQRSIEVIEAEGQSRQRRLFTDREGRLRQMPQMPAKSLIKFVGSASAGVWCLLVRQSAVARTGTGGVF